MIGPNDRRRKTSRCAACAGRRIKCQGGFPCDYCNRKNQACIPPCQKKMADLVIVQTYIPPNGKYVTPKALPSCIPSTVSLDLSTKLTKHFFTVFMAAHDFVGSQSLDIAAVATLCKSSPGLQNATLAVAALDASRRSPALSSSESNFASVSALNAYRLSLVALHKDLDTVHILHSDAYLWTTFFLGIFELMFDVTGNGWVKHILYGTSKLLQLKGPSGLLSRSTASFFLNFRVLEISRALIFNDHTFLYEKEWRAYTIQIWELNPIDWHPKEMLFDLMISCSALSMRGHALDQEEMPFTEELFGMANEGLQIQEALVSWSAEAANWTLSHESQSSGSSSVLADVYFHAISIFLSGIFDYRHYWKGMQTPTLQDAQVQNHVIAILTKAQSALHTTNLAGILFFFPLRVAGARVRTVEHQLLILDLLREIGKRNFVVATAFVEDLTQLWRL